MTEPTDTKLDPLHNPAVWFSALLLVFPLLLLIDMFYVHPTSYDGNLRTQIVTGVLAVIMMVGGYWLGTVANGAQKKADQPPAAPPAVPPAQGGFFRWQLLPWIVLVAVGAYMLTGCAGLNAQGVLTITYNTPAATTAATLTPGALAAAALPAKPASAP